MSRADTLKIGLAIHHIAMILDTESYMKVQPHLKTIEETCLKYVEDDEKEGE